MIQIGGRKILQLSNRKLVKEFIGEAATEALHTHNSGNHYRQKIIRRINFRWQIQIPGY